MLVSQSVGHDIPTRPLELIQLCGLLGYRIAVSRDGSDATYLGWTGVRDQTLTRASRRCVSAVAVNMPKHGYYYAGSTQETPMRLRVLHNPFADVPLPRDWFNDEEDEHISLVDGRWVSSRSNDL